MYLEVGYMFYCNYFVLDLIYVIDLRYREPR